MFLPRARVAALTLGYSAVLIGAAGAQVLSRVQTQVFSSPAYKREIGLTKEQEAEVDKLLAERRKKESEVFDRNKARRDAFLKEVSKRLSPDGREDAKIDVASLPPEAAEALREQGRATNLELEETKAALDRRLRKVLTPAQIRRASELWLQRLGPLAFLDEDVLRKLNIDDAKRLEIRQIIHGYEARRRAVIDEFMRIRDAAAKPILVERDGVKAVRTDEFEKAKAADPAVAKAIAASGKAMTEKQKALSEGYVPRILKTLTRRQRETYIKPLGDPFDPSAVPAPAGETKPAAAAPAKPPAPPKTKSLSERRGVSTKPDSP